MLFIAVQHVRLLHSMARRFESTAKERVFMAMLPNANRPDDLAR